MYSLILFKGGIEMLEKDRKRVYVVYLKGSGETYRVEEEYTKGLYNEKKIVNKVLSYLRYGGMDVVVLDGRDDVRPYINPFLKKVDKKTSKSRGF